jgi:inosine-uridine nucleoside N-ribohydrolase
MKPSVVFLLLLLIARATEPMPVLLDTDIGTDIDDTYALAQVVRGPELKLLSVTTFPVTPPSPAMPRLLAVFQRPALPVILGSGSARF